MPIQDDQSSPFALLVEAVDILEFCLGFDHPETGEAYSRVGLACQESGNYQGASLWLRRAFCVFFKSLGPHDEVTQSVHQSMTQVDANLDNTDLVDVPYEQLPQAILTIERQNQDLAR